MNDLIKKGVVKVPFTPYDIFGYLIPGASFLIGSYFFDFLIYQDTKILNFSPIYSTFHDLTINLKDSFIIGTIFLIILLIVAYVLGHIIASISSHFLDRILIDKGHGYPLQKLLSMNKDTIKKGRVSAYIRGAFFWVNIYLILQYCGFAFNIVPLTVIADTIIMCFLIYSFISLIFLIIYRINPVVESSRVEWDFLSKIQSVFNWSMMKLFAGPYDFISYLYSTLIRTSEFFDDTFVNKYKTYFSNNFDYDAEKAGTNNYWFAFLFVSEKSPMANSLINNWLFLYSFARNFSTCLLVLFIYAFVSIMYQLNISEISNQILIVPVLCFIAYLIMLTRYYYLYKNYYTKFIVRSYVFLNEMDKNKSLS